MCWDTDDELLVIDLDEAGTETQILGRNAVIPGPLRPVLTFDEVTAEQITAASSRAFQMIEMRGGLIPAAATLGGEESSWLYSDTAYSLFAQEIPLSLINDAERFVVRASVALVSPDGDVWTTGERVAKRDTDEWLNEKRAGAGRDPRVLQVPYSDGSHRITFPVAMEVMQPLIMGPLATGKIFPVTELVLPELLSSFRDSQSSPQTFVSNFLINMGIKPKSGLGLEITYLVLTLYLLVCVDHLDIQQLTAAEHIARRILQIMRAIEADPHSPNFAGLNNFMLHAHLASGVPYTPSWDKAMGERNRQDAQHLKNLSTVALRGCLGLGFRRLGRLLRVLDD